MDNRWTIDGICCTSHVVSHLRRAPIEVCFPHWHSGTTCPSASSQGTCLCNRRHLMTSDDICDISETTRQLVPLVPTSWPEHAPVPATSPQAKHGKTWQNMPSQDTIKIYQNTSCRCRLDPLNLLRKDSSKEQKVTESSFDSKSQFFSAGFFLHFVPSWKKESKGPSKKPNCRPHRFVIGAWFVRAILAVAIVVIDGGSCYLPIQDAN